MATRRYQPIGQTFGQLTVLSEEPIGQREKRRVNCVCTCGARVTVGLYRLIYGDTRSCGCLRDNMLRTQSRTHGDTIGGASPEYRAWRGAKTRCYNVLDKAFPEWGGRGITMCDRWRDSFEHFLADVGRRPSAKHSLDRFPDNNGNYEPGNTRWTTQKEQMRNTRTTSMLTYHGETMPLREWAERTNIPFTTLFHRVHRAKWSAERALTEPIQRRFLTYNGVTCGMTDWANSVGIAAETLAYQLRTGWSIEKALTEPVRHW